MTATMKIVITKAFWTYTTPVSLKYFFAVITSKNYHSFGSYVFVFNAQFTKPSKFCFDIFFSKVHLVFTLRLQKHMLNIKKEYK